MSRQLRHGETAPTIETRDIRNISISLQHYRGRYVLLSFYRYASCPLCNLRVHTLAQHYAGWRDRGLDLLAVFQSPREKMLQYIGTQNPPFPLIPDPEEKLYSLYGVEHSWLGFVKAWATRLPEIGKSIFRLGHLPGSVEGGIHRIPADFVISPDGVILEAYYGRDIGDHLSLDRVEHYLKATT